MWFKKQNRFLERQENIFYFGLFIFIRLHYSNRRDRLDEEFLARVLSWELFFPTLHCITNQLPTNDFRRTFSPLNKLRLYELVIKFVHTSDIVDNKTFLFVNKNLWLCVHLNSPHEFLLFLVMKRIEMRTQYPKNLPNNSL